VFDASKDSYIQTDIQSNFSPSFSTEIWFQRSNEDATGGSNVQQRLISLYENSQGSSMVGLGIQGNTIAVDTSGSTRVVTDTGFKPSTQWQHAVMTYDSATTTGKLYVNGALQNTFKQALNQGSSDKIKLGIVDATQVNSLLRRGFNGKISKVRLYSKALSQAEITQNFDQEKALFGFNNTAIALQVAKAAPTFAPANANSSTQSVSLGQIQFADQRSSFSPWSVTISVTDLAATSGGKIPATNVALNPGSQTLVVGSGTNNIPGSSAFFPGSGQNISLLSNSGNNGGGVVALSPTLSITVPTTATAGTYSGVVTISVS
jgi:hypothetical protein